MGNLNNPYGRTIHSTSGKAGVLNELLDTKSRGGITEERVLYRAEVVEIDTIGGNLTEARNVPESGFKNPKNSILAKVYTRNMDSHEDENNLTLCYPFLPQHLQLPIKVGEHVYVMFEDPISKNFAIWLWKIPEPYQTDDLNYTFSDDKPYALSNKEPESLYAIDSDSKTKTPKEIEEKVAGSIQKSNLVKEAVPNYQKDPHESVIQGSNNTLIRLTVDSQNKNSGLVDIVTGRGREESEGYVETIESKKPFSRGYEQIDRTSMNQNEGKVDLEKDSARVYISMNTNCDDKFGLSDVDPQSEEESAVVVKADAIRMIARKSLKIVSEDGQSFIVFDSDGNIKIGSGDSSRHLVTREEMEEYVNSLVDKFNNHDHDAVSLTTTATVGVGPAGVISGKVLPPSNKQQNFKPEEVPKILVD